MRSFIIAIIICFSPILSQTGYEIAKRVDEKPKPRFLSNKIEMVLKNSRDKTRTKQMISKSMNGGEKQIMWFLKPKTDYGVSFLKIEHDKGQDEMRIWLPNFGRVRRISSKKKGDSFMGSDLSYEDLSNRNLNENKYIRLEDETVDEINCYVLEIRPIGNIKTSYSKHISWINKSTLVTKKEKSYDKKGNLIKDKSFDYIFVEGYSVLNYVFIKNVQKNHTTQVYFSEIVLNSKIDEDIFNEKSLQNMPVD
tara:strand:- start:3295 stop:4047 length:753 start_codon:yes stop_codon:yes gene_type:complete